MQRDSGFLHLSEEFGPIAMLQSQKPIFFILLMAVTKITAASETRIQEKTYPASETRIQEKTYPIIHVGNECRIDTKNIHGCPVGWQEKKEWDVANTPIAILGKSIPLYCIEPCIKLLQHKIWFNCTSIQNVLVKCTYRCIKDDKVTETIFLFRDIQEPVPFANLTPVTPESKTSKLEVEKHMHIGLGISLGIAVLAGLSIWLIRQCKRTRRETDNEAIV